MEHPNRLRYRRLLDGFNSNDLAVVAEVLSPELVYTMPGKSSLAGRTQGIPDHIEMLRRARELSGGTLRLDPSAILADDEHLVVLGRISAKRHGKILDSEHCVLFRFSEGKIIEGRTVPTDLYEFDTFWA